MFSHRQFEAWFGVSEDASGMWQGRAESNTVTVAISHKRSTTKYGGPGTPRLFDVTGGCSMKSRSPLARLCDLAIVLNALAIGSPGIGTQRTTKPAPPKEKE